jgi:hypothetical protein
MRTQGGPESARQRELEAQEGFVIRHLHCARITFTQHRVDGLGT